MTHSAFPIHFLGVQLSDSFQICGVPPSRDSCFLRHSCRWQPHQVHPPACLPVRSGRCFAVRLCFAGISVSDDGALCLSPRALHFRSLSKHSMRLCAALTGGGGRGGGEGDDKTAVFRVTGLLGIPLWGQAPTTSSSGLKLE